MGKYAERMKSLLMDQIQKLRKQLDAYVRNPGHLPDALFFSRLLLT
ncbi:MAG: hypothetical protein ACOYJJ_05205 [Anaerovoracaceae bacterium]|jgi:hypothetical protein